MPSNSEIYKGHLMASAICWGLSLSVCRARFLLAQECAGAQCLLLSSPFFAHKSDRGVSFYSSFRHMLSFYFPLVQACKGMHTHLLHGPTTLFTRALFQIACEVLVWDFCTQLPCHPSVVLGLAIFMGSWTLHYYCMLLLYPKHGRACRSKHEGKQGLFFLLRVTSR